MPDSNEFNRNDVVVFAGAGQLIVVFASRTEWEAEYYAWRDTVQAFDAENGELLWTRTFEQGVDVVGRHLVGYEDGQAIVYR